MNTRDLLTEKRLHNLEPMVAEIDAKDLQSKIEAGETFKLVEVSNPRDFDEGHIARARNMSLEEIRSKALEIFHKFQQIVVYCVERNSTIGTHAARLFQQMGFTNVLKLKGGKEAWREAGLALEGQESES